MNRQQTLAELVRSTKGFLTRFLAGFDDTTRTKQAESLPNHVIWCLGHCAMTMHRVAERFDGRPLPESDFVRGDGTQGTGQQFDTETVCFGSRPVDDPELYPLLDRGKAIYEYACERLAQCIVDSPDAKFDEPQDWQGGPIPLWLLVMRVCFHNGTHAGQITDLRRALKMDAVIVPNR